MRRFTPLLAAAARRGRHRAGDRWQVDETDVRVAGKWRYSDRAVDQLGGGHRRVRAANPGLKAARRFLQRAINVARVAPGEATTDQAPVSPGVLEALLPAAWPRSEQHENHRIEADRGRLQARLRPVPGRKQDRNARVIIAGHAFVQNVRRGHCELAVDGPAGRRLATAFNELALAV